MAFLREVAPVAPWHSRVNHVTPGHPPPPRRPGEAARGVSGRFSGSCAALSWNEDDGLYRCGMASDPAAVIRWLPRIAAPLVARLAQRWISAASGCDSDLVVEAS
jgi:hypothetical protein